MSMLMMAGVTFLAIHLLISGTRLRDRITGAIGEGPYLGLFALASLATIVWLVISYNAAAASSENRMLYDLGRGVRDLGIPLIAIAFLLGVQGRHHLVRISRDGERRPCLGALLRNVSCGRVLRHLFDRCQARAQIGRSLEGVRGEDVQYSIRGGDRR